MDRAELLRAVGEIGWYHSIDLGGGIITPGHNTASDVARMGVPDRLDGKAVLDVGAWDGFWSFEAERRGASRVLATDSFVWAEDSRWGKRGFELARRVLGSNVEDRLIDVMDLTPEAVGTWDLVLFLGVLYHVTDPVKAIERVASVTGEQLILETETALDWYRQPAALCFPTNELADDDTNWWALNDRAIVGLLSRVGFTSIERYSKSSYLHRLKRAGLHRWPPGRGKKIGPLLRCRRSVYHARR